MSIIDQAKAHREGQALRRIEIKEWGKGDEPLSVYSAPLSVIGRRKCWRMPSGETVDGFQAMARAVVFHAVDKDGKRLFDDMDLHAMTHDVDSDVVARIGAFILGFEGKDAPRLITEQVDDAKND